jgi:tripartite-type tricarboxylate transporter receptor subunit TctC
MVNSRDDGDVALGRGMITTIKMSSGEAKMPAWRGMLKACLLACAMALFAPAASHAQSVADFYKDRRITIIVGSDAGSGYDAYARLLARNMGEHIPGRPGMIVQNMPGGGGITATNYLYNVAPRDGTMIGGMQRGVIILPLTAPAGVKFDPQKIQWIGSTTAESGVVAVWHTAPHKNISDVVEREIIIGGSGPATDSETLPRVYNKTLGTKFRIVSGYKSTGAILLAVERGEVQGIGNSSWSNWQTSFSHYLRDGRVSVLMQAGLERNPEIPNVPFALDLAKSPQDRQILELFLAPNTIGRPFAAPPETPADRVAALRSAFDAMVKDGAFVADAKKANMDLSPVSGIFIQQTLERLFATPPDILVQARAAIEIEKR